MHVGMTHPPRQDDQTHAIGVSACTAIQARMIGQRKRKVVVFPGSLHFFPGLERGDTLSPTQENAPGFIDPDP